MRIEVTEDRIEGWCELNGHETSVIAFTEMHGTWHTASSMCLPSNIDSAIKVVACMSAAFDALQLKLI